MDLDLVGMAGDVKSMRPKEFVGKRVVSMADGEEIGKVKDLVFTGLDLTALLVKGDRGEGLLSYGAIGANGPDAITIESYTLIDWSAGPALAPESRTIHEIEKLKVMDAEGNMIGHMHDFTMNSKGVIEEIAVRTDGVFGIGAHETVVPGSRVRAIGADMITVEKT
jgi:sporulation protein YlmC with PRC-barrel domain